MFPIDSETFDYDETMIRAFDALIPPEYPWKLRDVLPKVKRAGEVAGRLTEAGARFLDPTGTLKPGVPFAPPEGDAGTGMVATNAVRVNTGNVSAGTSAFIMIVTGKKLRPHPEINMVTTPDGLPVAMTHANTCTSDINAWVNLIDEALTLFGRSVDKNELYTKLFQAALDGAPDGGGLMACNCYSGEDVIGLDEGRPLFVRRPDATFTLSDFFRTHLMAALATLAVGVDILKKEEAVTVRSLRAHGGYFKTPGVGQRLLSAAVGVPVTVMETAGEGGPYGMALLASYMLRREAGESLPDYLDHKVFVDAKASVLSADETDIAGFRRFLDSYRKALSAEKAAIEALR